MAGEARHRISSGTVGAGVAVSVAYVATAILGFRVAFVAEQVTTVWPPTGIALAALLLGGLRFWPAVWVGAFAVNATSAAPLWTAGVLATGNTLEGVLAVWALRQVPSFDDGLRRVSDVLALVTVGAILCTTVSATIGVGTLCLAGEQPWSRFSVLWFDWWLGDALGALIVAPAILTTIRHVWSRPEVLTAAAFTAGAFTLTHFVFGQVIGPSPHPLEYVVFPLAIAAAVRGGPPVTSLVVLAVSMDTIWHTVKGAGPFAGPEVHQGLVLLQVFTGVLSGTALLVAAAVLERKTSERGEQAAAAVLREREQMLMLAQRAGGVAVFDWDVQSGTSQCSAELFRIFGLPARDGAMRADQWWSFLHPDDRERMTAHLDRAVEGLEPAAADYRIVGADGAVRWLSYAGQIQGPPDRRHIVGTVLDITDRKRTEMALREAKQVAESANQLKDQFLATLSHELRTPLNSILGYARMLQSRTIPADKQARAIDVIERNAVAQNRLIEDLLDMSRITAGKVRLDPAPVPVATVLREAVDAVKPAADTKGVALELDIDPAAGYVNADSTRLQQIFSNLLTNAVKFTPPEGRVGVSLECDGPSVEICVTDTGVGIPTEFLPFIFEPFRQADARFDRGHGGLGLGLAITKQLVELHGGTIHAASGGPGRGAAFSIRLPLTSAERSGGETAAAGIEARTRLEPVTASLDGCRILLVDDEPDTLTMFRDALEGAGARVQTAASAADALRLTQSWRPDLMVTDIGLPGMDGYELLQAIRARGPAFTFPAVAVSAYAGVDDRARALAVGFNAHVAKPIDPSTLVRALASALSPAE